MKVSYKTTVTKKVEQEVPDYFGYDSSTIGKLVDVLLEHKFEGYRNWRNPRDRLYDEDEDSVTDAIRELEDAYQFANLILTKWFNPIDAKSVKALQKIARGNDCKNPMSGKENMKIAKDALNDIGIDWVGVKK